MRLVQGQMGHILADHATRTDRRHEAGGEVAKRAFNAMMPMKKINVAAIEAAVRLTVPRVSQRPTPARRCPFNRVFFAIEWVYPARLLNP